MCELAWRPYPTAAPQKMPGPGFLPSPQRRLPGVGRRRSPPGGAGCCRNGGGVCVWSSGGGGSASGGLRPGVGPGRGAQRRRFGDPGLSSAASNSMGRFNVAPHAMLLKGQGPGADAGATAAQPPVPRRSSQAKPAPMAPPAPGSAAGSASRDVTAPATARQRGRSRKRAALGGQSATSQPAAFPAEEMERSGRRAWSPSNVGKAPTPASVAPRVPSSPPPLLPSLTEQPRWGGPLGFRTCASLAWGRGEFGVVGLEGVGSVSPGPVNLLCRPL